MGIREAVDSAIVATDERLALSAARLWRTQGPRAVTFGAVARAAVIGKSLASHHFPSQRKLMLAAGELVGATLLSRIKSIADALQQTENRVIGAARTDGPAILVERLLADGAEDAVCLLELCAEALKDKDFRPIVAQIFDAIGRIADIAGADAKLVLVTTLGELLQFVPIPRSPLGPVGLRERVLWLTAQGAAHRDLVEGFRALATHTVEPQAAVAMTIAASEGDPRDRIVRAARSLLAQGVYPSHRAIAAEAGVSLSATTYWFKTGTDILIGIYERIQSDVRDNADTAALANMSSVRDFVEVLAALLPYYSAQAESTVAHLHLVLLAARSPQLRDWAERVQQAEIDGLRTILQMLSSDVEVDLGRVTLSVISGRALELLLQSRLS